MLAASGIFLGLAQQPAQDSPSVPEPDRPNMEPQVAAKIQEHRQAATQHPDSPEIWGKLGIVFHAHGFFRQAYQCYEQAAHLEPQEFRWPYLMAHIIKDSEREKALALTERAFELMPYYAPVNVLFGELLEKEEQVEPALEQYQEAVANDSRCAPAEAGLGRLYLIQGNLEASLRHLLNAVRLNPDARQIRSSLVMVYRRMGDVEKARQEARLAAGLKGEMSLNDPVYHEISQEDVSSVALLVRANQREKAGDLDEAEAGYRQLLEIRPTDPNIHERLGVTLARQKKFPEAKEHFLRALEIKPENAPVLYELGTLLSLEGRYEEAVEKYRRSLELSPDHVLTLINLGSILAFQGQLEEAASTFERALEVDAGSFNAHRELAKVRAKQGKIEEAISHFQAALESRPDAGEIHLLLALALADAGELADAWNHLEEARRLGQNIPEELVKALKERLGK
jgi:tetratricopeptide (TPR) repeat protein